MENVTFHLDLGDVAVDLHLRHSAAALIRRDAAPIQGDADVQRIDVVGAVVEVQRNAGHEALVLAGQLVAGEGRQLFE